MALGKLYIAGELCGRWQAGGSLDAAASFGPSVRIGTAAVRQTILIVRPRFCSRASCAVLASINEFLHSTAFTMLLSNLIMLYKVIR